MEKTNNKIKYGLKNVHYAVITESETGTEEYATPVRVPGAVNLSLSSVFEQTVIPADDDPEYATLDENNGYDGDLEVQILPDQFKIDVLGDTLDENDVLIENKDAVTKPFALLFEFDGDAKKTRHLMYRCKAKRPNIESGTKGGGNGTKTDTLSIICRPAHNTGNIKAKAKQGDAAYDGWFTKVYTGTAQAASVNEE